MAIAGTTLAVPANMAGCCRQDTVAVDLEKRPPANQVGGRPKKWFPSVLD
jgi:hypothetical protein